MEMFKDDNKILCILIDVNDENILKSPKKAIATLGFCFTMLCPT